MTLGAFLDKRIDISGLLGYWVSQLAGAVLASLALALVTSKDIVAGTVTALNPGVEDFGGFVWEALLTAVFVMTILVVTRRSRNRRIRFLGIGLTLAAVHFAGVGITGASVNPARSFAPALVGGEWADIWIYIVGPLAGAVLAFVLYKVIVRGDLNFSDDVPVMAPAAKAPAARKPAARKPAAKPAARKPAARKPAAKK